MRLQRSGTALLAVILAAAVAGVGVGQERPDPKTDPKTEPKVVPAVAGKVETKDLDVAVKKSLRDVINRGAEMYNPPRNDVLGCYRLYEGALLTIWPLLDSRPALQQEIYTGLAAAEREPLIPQKAHVLRKVIDKVRDEVDPPSLWDRLGGEKGVTKVVDDFVAAAGADPKVNFFRDKKYPSTPEKVADIKHKLVTFMSKAAGGPLQYDGKDMKEVHKGMKITDAEFNALAGHLQTALEKNGVKPADVTAVMTAVGGTRKDIVESADAPKDPPKEPKETTLYERLGGEKGIVAVVDQLFAAAAKDEKVNFFRGKEQPPPERIAAIKKSVVAFMTEATGGPKEYKGLSMKDAHKDMKITDEEFTAFAGHLKAVLEDNKVKPDDIDLVMKAVGGTRKDIVEKKD